MAGILIYLKYAKIYAKIRYGWTLILLKVLQ